MFNVVGRIKGKGISEKGTESKESFDRGKSLSLYSIDS
jgi:hypothetical protein